MRTIGAFEAKTQFGSLIAAAERGEEIVITRHGRPVARLVPAESDRTRSAAEAAAARILERSRRLSLGGVTIKELIAEGRS